MTRTAPARPLADALRQPGTVLLDGSLADADTGREGAWLFSDPREVLRADAMDEVEPLVHSLDRALTRGHHVAGWLAYEAGYAFEPDRFAGALHPSPLGWFGVYDAPSPVSAADLADALPEAGGVVRLGAMMDAPGYAERIALIRHHIREGDVYQVNLTWPLLFEADDPLALYAALRARQPTAYGALIRTGDLDVLSLSPELFFRVSEGTITARPMKGTAPRGATPKDDRQRAEALTADPKNRAENLMIVDLLRNDLGRVAESGSVRVPDLFHAERYPTLTQMTSTVRADLQPGVGLADVMRALFPCGSVTGAPKLRAMELIQEIETGPRGVYCGAIGYAAPGPGGGLDRAAFNVPIRTAVLRGREGRYDVGSGVVWDSDWRSEWDECWLKAALLTGLAR